MKKRRKHNEVYTRFLNIGRRLDESLDSLGNIKLTTGYVVAANTPAAAATARPPPRKSKLEAFLRR